jgi:hypothetical protein
MIDTLPDDILHRQYLHIFGHHFTLKSMGFGVIPVNQNRPCRTSPTSVSMINIRVVALGGGKVLLGSGSLGFAIPAGIEIIHGVLTEQALNFTTKQGKDDLIRHREM